MSQQNQIKNQQKLEITLKKCLRKKVGGGRREEKEKILAFCW
jgi:hypothetical protein